jgi:hypothetical protein
LYLSSGPNGGYASGKVIPDFASIYNTNILDGLKAIYRNDMSFEGICDRILEHKDFKMSKCFIHSRLHFLQDKGGKTRNIAIGDQFTQMGLKPLHKAIFALLYKLRCDGTKDQQRAVQDIFKALRLNSVGKLRRFKSLAELDIPFNHENKINNNFYSIDMKSCTERFPVKFQS